MHAELGASVQLLQSRAQIIGIPGGENLVHTGFVNHVERAGARYERILISLAVL